MKKLLLDSLSLGKDVLFLRAPGEIYVLLGLKGAGALALGLLVGSLL